MQNQPLSPARQLPKTIFDNEIMSAHCTIGLFEELHSIGVQGEKLLGHFNERDKDFPELRLKLMENVFYLFI